ncbi:MAG: hypothetical protein JO147_09915 [Actinobacteria bacterium]|nr:hypothetical protein [Actinomycetota bacterium]
MTKTGLAEYLSGIYQKPQSYFETGLERYKIPVVPDFVIDDHAEIVEHFGGWQIPRYEYEDLPDDELLNVLTLVAAELERSSGSESSAEIETSVAP